MTAPSDFTFKRSDRGGNESYDCFRSRPGKTSHPAFLGWIAYMSPRCWLASVITTPASERFFPSRGKGAQWLHKIARGRRPQHSGGQAA